MANEEVILEEPNKPFITIDDVQVFVEDLPEEGQQIFGRLQRLNQKKANIVLDLEELQAGIGFFSNRIVAIYNDEESPLEETELDESTEES
jgi:acyl-CoA hydrolase